MKVLSIFGTSAALAVLSLALGCPGAYAQAEIDPDHFDSPNTEPFPQPKAAGGIRYNGTFSLPYSVLCNGKKLAPGKYSISLRCDGNVGRATLNQKGHVIEIARVVQTEAPRQRDEVVVVENNSGRMLSLVRVSGFAFALDPKHPEDASTNSRPPRTEELPLTVASNEVANQVSSQALAKP